MKIILLSLLLICFLVLPQDVSAVDKHSDGSADIKIIQNGPSQTDLRPVTLRKFLLSYSSPLADFSDFIVSISDAYGLPWQLIPAISGVESTFCKRIPRNSYNCWGWNNGNYYFMDFEDGIHTVAKGLKFNYINRGLTDPYKIQPVYAPPSATWGGKVKHFMDLLDSSTTLPSVDLGI